MSGYTASYVFRSAEGRRTLVTDEQRAARRRSLDAAREYARRKRVERGRLRSGGAA